MSASVTGSGTWQPGDSADRLALTGERTVPGLAEENYWFRRHEVVYQRLAGRCAVATCWRPAAARATAPT